MLQTEQAAERALERLSLGEAQMRLVLVNPSVVPAHMHDGPILDLVPKYETREKSRMNSISFQNNVDSNNGSPRVKSSLLWHRINQRS